MTFIYLLVDPRVTSCRAEDEVRYVGYSSRPPIRLLEHIDDGLGDCQTYKSRWIRELISLGFEPQMKVVDITGDTDAEIEFAETFWIRFYREEVGARLTNTTDGGDIPPSQKGTTRSQASNQKISDTLRQKFLVDPVFRTNVIEANNRIADSRRGKPSLPCVMGTRKKISESMSLVRKSKRDAGIDKHSDETRKRISLGVKHYLQQLGQAASVR